MKKRTVMLLCAAALTLGLAAAPALASAGPIYPIEEEAYTYGPLDELRINKVYKLSVADDPSCIPTEDFERNGRRYYLLDTIAGNNDGEVVTYTVVFGSVDLTRDEGYAAAHGQSGFRPLDADSFKKGMDPDLLPLFVCMSCAVTAAVIVFCSNKAKQRRFKPRYGKNHSERSVEE